MVKMVFIVGLHEKEGEILLCEMVMSRGISTPLHLENSLSFWIHGSDCTLHGSGLDRTNRDQAGLWFGNRKSNIILEMNGQ